MTRDVVRWIRFATSTDAPIGFGTLDPSSRDVAVHEGDMFGASTPTGERWSLDDTVVLPPCQPSKIIGLWNNLEAAANKNGWARPAEPLYFFKPATACSVAARPSCRPRRTPAASSMRASWAS